MRLVIAGEYTSLDGVKVTPWATGVTITVLWGAGESVTVPDLWFIQIYFEIV